MQCAWDKCNHLVAGMTYHDPRCIFRCIFWGAVAALIALLLSEAVRACGDYTPDPVTIPPTIEVRT